MAAVTSERDRSQRGIGKNTLNVGARRKRGQRTRPSAVSQVDFDKLARIVRIMFEDKVFPRD